MIDLGALFRTVEYSGDAPQKAKMDLLRQQRQEAAMWNQRTYFYTPVSDDKAQKASQRRKRARSAAILPEPSKKPASQALRGLQGHI